MQMDKTKNFNAESRLEHMMMQDPKMLEEVVQ